jgi:hypothetical protein
MAKQQIISKPNTATTASPRSVYNPLSKLAVIGLGCSILYAGIVAMSALSAIWNRTPLFLPDWLLIMPVAGAATSLLAWRQIRNAEATLSGETLTRWGLWLSVLTALGYEAYYMATVEAVKQQASSFLTTKAEETGFFPYLQEGDINRAFLLTLRWKQRQNSSPDDPKSMARFTLPTEASLTGAINQFADNFITLWILQAGREKKPIELLGVKSWKYDRGEYQIEYSCRLETEEATMDLLVPVHSNDQDDVGGPRRWNVVWNDVRIGTMTKLTTLGKKMMDLRGKAHQYAAGWSSKLKDGKLDPPLPKDETDWAKLGQSIQSEKLQRQVEEEVKSLFAGKGTGKDEVEFSDKLLSPWRMQDGHIQFLTRATIQLPLQLDGKKRMVWAITELTCQLKEKVSPAQIQPAQPSTWEIVGVKVLQLRELGP